MALAGEMTARSLDGVLPGTFRMRLFDFIYNMTTEDVLKEGKIKWL